MTRSSLTEFMPAGKPDAEIEVDAALVSRLLEQQHPDLGHLPLTHLDSGWDNVLFRLGNEYVVRIPRREIAAGLMRNEQRWLPELAPRLPIAVPEPFRVGTPTAFYPWHWSVLPWFEGRCADELPPVHDQAERFAAFLLALHKPAPDDAPENPVRGVPLSVRVENTQKRMIRVRQKTNLLSPALEALWEVALSSPGSTVRCWLHGDLHAQNVLVDSDGAFSAIIDWGDITAGDAATDLAGTWALFESATAREKVLQAYEADMDLLNRARGWAILFGIVLLDSGLINSPRHAEAGRKILQRLSADA